MIVRWQERKAEDELLKRELLFQLRTEYDATPGRSRPAADDYRRRTRHMLLRHPLFAFKYYRLARVSAGVVVSREMPADDPCAPFPFDFDAVYRAEEWSARIAWRAFAYETGPDEESGIENPTGRVLAHRVGDADRVYAFDPDDLAPLTGARLVEEGIRQRLILFACVLAVVVLASAATAAVVESHHVGPNGGAASAASASSQPAFRFPRRWWHPPRVVATSPVGARNHPHPPKRFEPPTARSTRKPAQQSILVSNTVPTVSVPTRAASKPEATGTAGTHGAVPIPAPPGKSAPSPLKAP